MATEIAINASIQAIAAQRNHALDVAAQQAGQIAELQNMAGELQTENDKLRAEIEKLKTPEKPKKTAA